MSKVMTFSRAYPSYHPKAGKDTYFVEKIWRSIGLNENNLFKFLSYIEAYNSLTSDTNSDELIDFETLSPKHHTIRSGHRWKEGDWFRPVVWGNDVNPKSGRSGPYNSKQITFAPDIQVKKVWNITVNHDGLFVINGELYAYPNSDFALRPLAQNDGLDVADLLAWFNKPFTGQIICWNENIEY